MQNGASGHLTGYERQLRARLVQQRGYSAGSGGMSAADLEEGVLKVLKLFDKVHAEKARSGRGGRGLDRVGVHVLT